MAIFTKPDAMANSVELSILADFYLTMRKINFLDYTPDQSITFYHKWKLFYQNFNFCFIIVRINCCTVKTYTVSWFYHIKKITQKFKQKKKIVMKSTQTARFLSNKTNCFFFSLYYFVSSNMLFIGVSLAMYIWIMI